MIRYRFAVLLGSLVFFMQPGQAQTSAASADAGLNELTATIDAYAAAYDSGEVDQVMSYWSENADFVDIRGRFHEGRDLIAALFRRGFAENPGRKLQLNSASRKFLSPEVAMDDGILELTSPDGSKVSGRYTVVWTKVDGKWLIRSARDIPIEVETPVPEVQTPPLEELSWLLGKWEAKTEEYSIELSCDWTLDKSFLMQNFRVKSSDEDFQVVTYIAFDPSQGQFQSWFFDSRGGFGGGVWIRSEDTYRIGSVMVLPDGQIGSSVMTWEKVDADTIVWQALEREVGGESIPDTKQTYTRVK